MIYGLTLDNVYSPAVLQAGMNGFPKRVTARVCFDPGMDPEEYLQAVKILATACDVMGQPVDSSEASRLNPEAYYHRFIAYYEALKPYVSIWETGNEINGDWLPSDIVTRTRDVNSYIRAHGGKTHCCFYGDPNLTPFLERSGFDSGIFDSVGISYYEQDNDGLPYDWESNLKFLGEAFPHTPLLISECGTASPKKKEHLLKYYYQDLFHRLKTIPMFQGGGFWWYARQDFFPKTKPLYQTFSALFA